MKIQYRFKLTIDGTTYDTSPDFPDGQTITGDRDTRHYWKLEKFGSTLKFKGADYTRIKARPVDEQMTLTIQKSLDYGETFTDRLTAQFTKADAQLWDHNKKTVDVVFETISLYDTIQAAKSKTFNIPALEPPKVTLNGVRQPLFQIYIEGSTFINNFLGSGVHWETPLPGGTPVYDAPGSTLIGDNFFQITIEDYIIPGDATTLDPDVSGRYDRDTLIRTDNVYKIVTIGSGPTAYYEIQQVSDSTPVYRSDTGTFLSPGDPYSVSGTNELFPTTARATFTSLSSTSECRAYIAAFYARMLTNLETVGGTPTNELPEDGIIPENFNYTRCLPIDLTGLIEITDLNSVDPTRYNKYSDDAASFGGNYFVRPANNGTEEYQPISQSEWEAYTIWWYKDAAIRAYQQSAAQQIQIRDAYRLADVIAKLLQEIDPTLEHEATSEYSEFLYGSTNSIRGGQKHPIITPKEHVTIGDYDQPVTIAEAKFEDLDNLLYGKYRCHWHLVGTKFKIEHEDYYERGGTYTGTSIGKDVTGLIEGHTAKPWTFDRDKWSYDKANIPERIEFNWMDQVSQPFDGFPIDLLSAYAQRGNVQTIDINLFSSDFDYMIAQPGEIARSGFFIADCDQDSADEYTMPFVTMVIDGTTYTLQNGYSAFFYIHSQYYQTRLAAKRARINLVEIEADVVRRVIQEITLPATELTSFLQLLTSNLGDGIIEKYEENIVNGTFKITLKHDTENTG